MSEFIGTLNGASGRPGIRRGTISSGLHYQAAGFQSTVEVHSLFDKKTGKEVHFLYMAPGSNYPFRKLIRFGVIIDVEGKPHFAPLENEVIHE